MRANTTTGATVAQKTTSNDDTAPKYTRDDLAEKVREAYSNYYAVRVKTIDEDAQKLVNILDAIEYDLRAKMTNCKLFDDLAHEYTDRADLLEVIGSDPEKCFNFGRYAYAFNPLRPDDKNDSFNDSAEYIALDGYERLCAIRDRATLACWYDGNISDYFGGIYGDDLDADAMQELAEVFGGDYDREEVEK